MSEPVVYGADYSTYVRTVRMTLEEKGAAYRLEPVDIMSGEAQAPAHLARHPFGKIPAFEHDGFSLYESGAIARYVDEVFDVPRLQPEDARPRARMNQIVGVIDAYAYRCFVWDLFVERNAQAFLQRSTDEKAIEAAMPQAHRCMGALEALAGDGRFLCGEAVSLADCWLVPVMHYLASTPEGAELLDASPRVSRWWGGIGERDSVRRTAPTE